MPPRPSVPGVCQVLLKGNFGGTHNWVNKLFISYSGAAPTAVELTAYAGNLYTIVATNLSPLQPVATAFTDVEVTDLSSAMGAVGLHSATAPGSRVGGDIPGSACALISYPIGRHYRGGHPRTYLPVGTTLDMLTQSTWLALFVTSVSDAWDAIVSGLRTPSGGLAVTGQVNVSYFGGAPTVGGESVLRLVPLVDPISLFRVSPELASQRRRIGRR